MHWLLNVVTGEDGGPGAVLIRAIHPVEGQIAMADNRPYNAHKRGWTDGPAKLTQALAVDKKFNGIDLCNPGNQLWIENGEPIPDHQVERTPRIGLNSVPEPWRSIPWRFNVNQGSGYG
jgi:DNA-3-methyladenine glycosylase